jgi:hypothetical protein
MRWASARVRGRRARRARCRAARRAPQDLARRRRAPRPARPLPAPGPHARPPAGPVTAPRTAAAAARPSGVPPPPPPSSRPADGASTSGQRLDDDRVIWWQAKPRQSAPPRQGLMTKGEGRFINGAAWAGGGASGVGGGDRSKPLCRIAIREQPPAASRPLETPHPTAPHPHHHARSPHAETVIGFAGSTRTGRTTAVGSQLDLPQVGGVGGWGRGGWWWFWAGACGLAHRRAWRAGSGKDLPPLPSPPLLPPPLLPPNAPSPTPTPRWSRLCATSFWRRSCRSTRWARGSARRRWALLAAGRRRRARGRSGRTEIRAALLRGSEPRQAASTPGLRRRIPDRTFGRSAAPTTGHRGVRGDGARARDAPRGGARGGAQQRVVAHRQLPAAAYVSSSVGVWGAPPRLWRGLVPAPCLPLCMHPPDSPCPHSARPPSSAPPTQRHAPPRALHLWAVLPRTRRRGAAGAAPCGAARGPGRRGRAGARPSCRPGPLCAPRLHSTPCALTSNPQRPLPTPLGPRTLPVRLPPLGPHRGGHQPAVRPRCRDCGRDGRADGGHRRDGGRAGRGVGGSGAVGRARGPQARRGGRRRTLPRLHLPSRPHHQPLSPPGGV